MGLSNDLEAELKKLIGLSSPDPKPTTISAANVDVAIDFLAVESMSCSFREIRLRVPSLANSGVDTLKTWAEDLCNRITYLLENIGPLEVDPAGDRVLIRSTPPDTQDNATQFYEILLESHANGNFSLRRYRSEKGTPGRTQVDIQTTHEVLQKLVGDLVDTIPTAA